jgi:diadenosine tetraphosphate (Ap4A) HIT family hydrolase
MKGRPVPFFDSDYVVYEGNAWNVILHRDNQFYLGRCIVFLKSRISDDPLSCTTSEQQELWHVILPTLARALKAAFGVDRLNYAHLANVEHFVHWHVIPRYEKNPRRHFAGEEFRDDRAGSNYAPSPVKKLPHQVMVQICARLKSTFEASLSEVANDEGHMPIAEAA